jgi:membrane associated rhomboid family serine protease
MIPLRDIIPSRSTPYVTLSLIALTTLVWCLELTQPPAALARVLQDYGVVPEHVRGGTLLSAPFLHSSWLHVIGNMWCLWIFGENVEDRIGHVGFILFYAFCGAAGAIGYAMLAHPSSLPTVGASGAVASVVGAYIVLYPRSRILTLAGFGTRWDLVELPAVGILWVWFLIQFIGAGAVSPTAHTHDPAPAFASYAMSFLVGAGGVVALGKRRTPAEWWCA